MVGDSWITLEKLATIVERHIEPNARVRRNVTLPVLGSSSGRTRQCDIVIEAGKKPRVTTSIVEAQKRKDKPEIGEFDGWIEKMREVGAQHLICVSKTGYPKSIEEKADQIGPTVRLLTLKQLEQGNWPLPPTVFSDFLLMVQYDKLVGLEMVFGHLVKKDPNQKLPSPHDKVFRSKGHLMSITDIIDWHLFGKPENIDELPKNNQFSLVVTYGKEIETIFEYKTHTGLWVPLQTLKIHIKLQIHQKEIAWESMMYEQRDWGEIAWVLRATATVSTKQYDLVIPFKRIAPGEYSMGRPIILGDFDAFLAVGKKGFKAKRYTDQ